MKTPPHRRIQVKLLVPILILQFVSLSLLGWLNYSSSSERLKNSANRRFREAVVDATQSLQREIKNKGPSEASINTALDEVRLRVQSLMLFDDKGNLLSKRGTDIVLPHIAWQIVQSHQNGNQTEVLQSNDYLFLHTLYTPPGWHLIALDNRFNIYGGIYKLRNHTLIVTGISLLVSSILLFLIIRSITNPIGTLTKTANRIAQGELGITALSRTNDEVGELTEAFNQMSVATKNMTDELEEKNTRLSQMNYVRRQLIHILSHELRSPLNAVVNFFDLIEEEVASDNFTKETDEFKNLIHNLGQSIEKNKLIVERLTRASAIISGQIRSAEEITESTSLLEVLPVVVDDAARHAASRKITTQSNIPADSEIRCSTEAFKLILTEALSNAVKYSSDGGQVLVSTEVHPDKVLLSIRDYGEGIPAHFQKDVIEPFFETRDADLHTSTRYGAKGGGLGLGLTLISSAVKLYHGKLQILSPAGGGTELQITLPCC